MSDEDEFGHYDRSCFGMCPGADVWELVESDEDDIENELVLDRGIEPMTLSELPSLFLPKRLRNRKGEKYADFDDDSLRDNVPPEPSKSGEFDSELDGMDLQEIDLSDEIGHAPKAIGVAGKKGAKVRDLRPWYQRLLGQLVKLFLPRKGQYADYFAGLGFDIGALLTIILIITFTVGWNEAIKYWYMPLISIFASTIGMATPAGGGIIYFPVLTLLGQSSSAAVAFSLGGQFFGMAIAGTFQWCRRSFESICWWLVVEVVFFGWIGSCISMLAIPIQNDVILRLMFWVFTLILATYICYGLWAGTISTQDNDVPCTVWSVCVFAVIGLVGGLLVGWVAVGIDTMLFFVCCSVYAVNSRTATVNSILVMGWTALLPFLIHVFYYEDVPWTLLLMALIGILLGSKLGPIFNHLLGRKRIMVIFVFLLFVEILRTFIQYLILPIFSGNFNFFWECLSKNKNGC
eukprot:TRINITY_DN4067_c0_g1_i1.p1 TRINITY_DN4067_c0_g1~~TRINITY_DN4067_c0_g1_i1.p1  ORF type:complete len:461 (-),score=93.47 TRINITY_DN4067_c0_g1_i1:709-2091(-)